MISTTFNELMPDTELPAAFVPVFEGWTAMERQAGLPLAADFSLERVPLGLLPWSILVDVIDEDPRDFHFRFWGTKRTNLIGSEMTGKRLSQIANESMRAGNRDEYEDVCVRAKPMLYDTPIVTSLGNALSMVSVRLPFGDGTGRVTRIFSAVDPQSITKRHYEHYGTYPKRGL